MFRAIKLHNNCQSKTPQPLCIDITNTMSNPDGPKPAAKLAEAKPGDGIRSLQSTTLFRVVNFELYAKPVSDVAGLTKSGRR